MAVAVEQDAPWARPQRHRELPTLPLVLDERFEERTCLGDSAGSLLRLAAEQVRRIFPDGRQAARFEEDDPRPAVDERRQALRVLGGAPPSLVQQPL